MPRIWKSWTWKSAPLSFVSSELCFLPHLLNINDTQNKARKGSVGGPTMLSVAAREPTWEPELGPRRKYILKDWIYHSYLLFEPGSEKFDSVLKRLLNKCTRIYKSQQVLSSDVLTPSPLPLPFLTIHLGFLLGITSDLSHPRFSFEPEMASSSWVTHLLLPNFSSSDLELILEMRSALKRHRAIITEVM